MVFVRRNGAKRTSGKRTSARSTRTKRRVRTPYRRRTTMLRRPKPEVKCVQVYYPLAPATLDFATTFTTTYPQERTWNSNTGTFPSQGTDYNNRIGNKIQRIGYQLDLFFQCADVNVDCRFVVFKWRSPENPDVVTWPDPTTSSGGVDGSTMNTWFAAKSNAWMTVLYQKSWRFGNRASQTGVTPRYHVKKFFKFNEMVSATDNLGQPANMTSSTISSQTTYKDRIYFCVITNNLAGSDIAMCGYVRHYFLDA